MIGRVMQPHSTTGADLSLYNDWPFQLYLLRYFDISTEPTDTGSLEYYIAPKENGHSVPPGFQKVELNTVKVTLYRNKKTGGNTGY